MPPFQPRSSSPGCRWATGALVAAAILGAACSADDSADIIAVDATTGGDQEDERQAGPTDGEIVAGPLRVGWVPEGFDEVDSSRGVQDLWPEGDGGESRFASVTLAAPAAEGATLAEQPDLTISVSEEAEVPRASDGLALSGYPRGDGVVEYGSRIVPLATGSSAVLTYNQNLRFGSVDFLIGDHVLVVVAGGPLSEEELVQVAESVTMPGYEPCLRDSTWRFDVDGCAVTVE